MRAGPPGRVLLVFLDGVGIGEGDPESNPFLSARLPVLREILGGKLPTRNEPEITPGPDAVAFPLDPLLGVEGTPQSGTGHTALFTGVNAPRLYGRHFGPWVPVSLRPVLETRNLLVRAQSMGSEALFANAYPRGFERTRWARRPAGPPLMARAAGLLVRHEEALARGEAISSEIVNTAWRKHMGFDSLPDTTPQQAGATLARIAGQAHLTFFAHYGTDHAGHQGSMAASRASLERVDAFLGGVIPALTAGTLLVVASDHGNVEEVGRRHTLNPTFTLLLGPGAREWRRGLQAITDIPGMILECLRGGG